MTQAQIIQANGLTPVEYADVVFGELCGTCSQESGKKGLYRAICLTIQDNDISDNDLDAMILSYDIVKEIAYSCDILYTNFGCAVHSHTMKSLPFSNLKIVKISN